MRIHFSSSMDSLLLISGDLCIVKHSTVCMMRYQAPLPRAPRRGAPWARAAKNVKKSESNVEELDVRFLQNKTETFLVFSHKFDSEVYYCTK